MPLDDTTGFLAVPAETKPDLSRPSLEALAYILRHREEWPMTTSGRRWKWDFSDVSNECGTAGCALGIAGCQWPQPGWKPNLASHSFDRGVAIEEFGLGEHASLAIFCAGDADPAVSPAVVASRIDDYLAGRAVRYLVEGDRS